MQCTASRVLAMRPGAITRFRAGRPSKPDASFGRVAQDSVSSLANSFHDIWIDSLNGDKYRTGKIIPQGQPLYQCT